MDHLNKLISKDLVVAAISYYNMLSDPLKKDAGVLVKSKTLLIGKLKLIYAKKWLLVHQYPHDFLKLGYWSYMHILICWYEYPPTRARTQAHTHI